MAPTPLRPGVPGHWRNPEEAFLDPTCPEHVLLNTPTNSAAALEALLHVANPTQAVLERAVGALNPADLRFNENVAALATAQPTLSRGQVRTLMRALGDTIQEEEGLAISVPALLAHPVVVADESLAATLLTPPIVDLLELYVALVGSRNRHEIFTVMCAHRHPVAAAVAYRRRCPYPIADGITLTDIDHALDLFHRTADAAGIDHAELAATILRLDESWTGTGEELLESAAAILTR